ncbi:MAG: AAA family ATPase [Promethearchaeota archaeon]
MLPTKDPKDVIRKQGFNLDEKIDTKPSKDATVLKKSPGDAGVPQDVPLVDELAIKPQGYAIRIRGSEKSRNVIIDDIDLFEKYCVEQWNSMQVDVGTYLFDQFILPDYAFQVIGVRPHAGKIHSKTKIILIQESPSESMRISPVNLVDVIGQEDAKKKAILVLKYLEDPDIFGIEWSPRNILFFGPPGTGKTMMARAIAQEAGAAFIARSGTSLIGVHVGDGAKKIHELYATASSISPCIVFIDELDAVGLSRSFQHVRGDVIEVSTALLAELDGLEERKGIVTIACTNQVNLLDPALRSRFDEEIMFDLPGFEDRVKLLKSYAKKTPLDVQIDFKIVASKLHNWSGRDIKNRFFKTLIHEAIMDGKKAITNEMASNLTKKLIHKVRSANPSLFSI